MYTYINANKFVIYTLVNMYGIGEVHVVNFQIILAWLIA